MVMLTKVTDGARGRRGGRGTQWTWCVALIWTGTGVLPMTEVFLEVKRVTQRLGGVEGMGQEGIVGVIGGWENKLKGKGEKQLEEEMKHLMGGRRMV